VKRPIFPGVKISSTIRPLCVLGRSLVIAALGLGRVPAVRAQADSTPPPLSLRLNVAARRLDLYSNGQWLVSYRVAVGMWDYPTPTGNFKLTTVEWRPWWIPPAREWTEGQDTMPPGPDNPMGRVKLYFKPLYFFHGTPDVGSIGTAASHGCVRMRNRDAVALAMRVMRAGLPNFTSAQVAKIARDTITTSWPLARPVPVTVTYETIEWQRDTLRLYPDIYGFGVVATVDTVLALLAAHDMDSARADTATIFNLVEESEWQSVVVPVEKLLVPE